MRELVLMAIVGCICLRSLVSPVIGLYGYIWFALLRPDMLAWSNRPYSMFLAVAILAGLIRYLYLTPRLLSNPIVLTLLALQVPVWLSAIFAVEPRLAKNPYDLYLRVVGMALLVPLLIRTERELKTLMILMAGSLGALGLKYGLFGMLHGGVRFNDGPGGFLADNNCFALAMVIAVPLLWYARDLVAPVWARTALAAGVFFTVAAVVMTFSRGAAVALAVTFLLMVTQSKRKIGLLVVVALVCGPAIYLVKDAYFDRLSTIKNPAEEASANSRITYAKVAIRMAQDYPWLGVGFGTYNQMRMEKLYLPHVDDVHTQVVHNTYLQMLTDSGVFAFGLYVLLLFGTIFWLGASTRRMRNLDPQLAVIPRALQAALVAYAVGSTFLSRVQFDITYFLLMTAAAWQRIERERRQRAYAEYRAAGDEDETPDAAETAAPGCPQEGTLNPA